MGQKDMYVDLGARQPLGSRTGRTKIAVEIKSFGGTSEMEDLKNAVGQFVFTELSCVKPIQLGFYIWQFAT
jgi:hypothetical protein